MSDKKLSFFLAILQFCTDQRLFKYLIPKNVKDHKLVAAGTFYARRSFEINYGCLIRSSVLSFLGLLVWNVALSFKGTCKGKTSCVSSKALDVLSTKIKIFF